MLITDKRPGSQRVPGLLSVLLFHKISTSVQASASFSSLHSAFLRQRIPLASSTNFQKQQFWNRIFPTLCYTGFTVRITIQLGGFEWTQ